MKHVPCPECGGVVRYNVHAHGTNFDPTYCARCSERHFETPKAIATLKKLVGRPEACEDRISNQPSERARK
jgi:hypothetical protein